MLAALDQFRQFDKPAEVRRALVGDVHGAVLLEKLLSRQAEPWRFVDFAVPIRNVQGDLLGVFGSHLSWAWARQVKRELIDAALIEHEADALIIARDGTVLLGPPGLEGKLLVGISPGLLSFAGATDSASLTRVNGVPYFIASTVTRGKDNYPGHPARRVAGASRRRAHGRLAAGHGATGRQRATAGIAEPHRQPDRLPESPSVRRAFARGDGAHPTQSLADGGAVHRRGQIQAHQR